MRVLIVGSGKTRGGIESFIHNYYLQFINCDDIERMDITTYDDDIAFRDDYNNKKTQIFFTGRFIHIKKYVRALNEIIGRGHYDVVHYNMNSAVNLLPLKIAKKYNIKKIIAHAHNSSSDKGILKTILHNFQRHKIKKFANIFLSCSASASKWFFKNENVTVIPNSIYYEKYAYSTIFRSAVREKLNLKDEILLGNVARFNRQKNHIFMLNIIKNMPNNYKLLFIGSGPLKNKIYKKSLKMKLENKIIFLNETDKIYKFYSAMDCFILPSLYEGLPFAGIEAQVNGLPCVFSDNITNELTITNNVKYISIKKADKWVTILKNISRKETKYISDKYNIIKNFEILHEIYSSN